MFIMNTVTNGVMSLFIIDWFDFNVNGVNYMRARIKKSLSLSDIDTTKLIIINQNDLLLV